MFGDKLKRLRAEKGVTQNALATYLGFTHVAVVKWENGQREPDFATLVKIAEYFDVSTDSLLGREKTFSGENLTLAEIELVNSYRTVGNKFGKSGQENVDRFINLMLEIKI